MTDTPDELDFEHETQPALTVEVNADNEFGLGSQLGTVRPIAYPAFTTKHQAWRFIAWLKSLAEVLPDEAGQESFDYDDILHAVQNS